jgi:hypothetical protein
MQPHPATSDCLHSAVHSKLGWEEAYPAYAPTTFLAAAFGVAFFADFAGLAALGFFADFGFLTALVDLTALADFVSF